MSGFPTHDWQFWAATLAGLFAAAWLLRTVLPIPVLSRRQRVRKSERRVKLTISAARPPRGDTPPAQ